MKKLLSGLTSSFDAEIRKLRKTINLVGGDTFNGITASVDENGLVTWSTNSIDITDESILGSLTISWSINGVNLPQENYLRCKLPDNDDYNMRIGAPLSQEKVIGILSDANLYDGDICHLNIFYEDESGEQQQITFDSMGLKCKISATPVWPNSVI